MRNTTNPTGTPGIKNLTKMRSARQSGTASLQWFITKSNKRIWINAPYQMNIGLIFLGLLKSGMTGRGNLSTIITPHPRIRLISPRQSTPTATRAPVLHALRRIPSPSRDSRIMWVISGFITTVSYEIRKINPSGVKSVLEVRNSVDFKPRRTWS